eukprot:3111386-Lingulodinium_polyedra.AAC.1
MDVPDALPGRLLPDQLLHNASNVDDPDARNSIVRTGQPVTPLLRAGVRNAKADGVHFLGVKERDGGVHDEPQPVASAR